MIYKARLLDKIDNDTMLRLCFIVNKSFFLDLKKLPDYVEDKTQDTIAACNYSAIHFMPQQFHRKGSLAETPCHNHKAGAISSN